MAGAGGVACRLQLQPAAPPVAWVIPREKLGHFPHAQKRAPPKPPLLRAGGAV